MKRRMCIASQICSRSIRGFTIVELLVSLAVIAVLASLILPAVQRSRASARRLNCSNRLRQIAIALHNFESIHGSFPAGKTEYNNPKTPEMSWHVALLPHLEQGAMWNLTMQAFERKKSPYENPPHWGFSQTVTAFVCPEDSFASVPQSATSVYGAYVGLTSFLGVCGIDHTTNDGVLLYEKRVRFADISDGTSNTIAVGERPPTPDANYGWWYSGWGQDGSGNMDLTLGVREWVSLDSLLFGEPCRQPSHFGPGPANSMCDGLHFWSHHNGGAHFALCDGSVSFMSYESADILQKLATRSAGE